MTSNSNKTIISEQLGGGVVLHGYLTKLKTMRKKYFVLYEDCGKSLARLEYYDNEKKFKTKASPKRTIVLSSCFNINRRLDTKHDFAICLSTKDEGFGIVMDTEEDMDKWLKAMLKLQNGQNIFAGQPRPYYEHVWQVVVQRKGLAEKKGILGNYHVCLSSKSVTLIRIGSERTNIGETRAPLVEFYLTSIRRCGDSKCYFYMEVGRHSVVGAGELWMETKDSLIAQNMHTMILNVMSSNADDPYGPMRKRSSSATETSKPVTILQRRQTHSGSKTLNSSPSSVLNRDRCDSLPSSRNRTNTESGYNSFANTSMPPSRTMSSLTNVPNSVYNNRHSHSPPMNSNALSPSVGCSESDGSTLSIDEPDSMKHSLTPDDNSGFASRFYNSRSPGGVIPEENSDDFWCTENKKQNTIDNALILDKLNIQTLSSSTNIHSEEPESQYMDMFSSISPCETAICDTNLAGGADFPYKSCNDSSDGNSHASSLAEEVVNGYVHMSSPQTSDYVDMGQSLKSRRYLMNMNSSSARNIASDIPLKDMCFAEYPIEKVNPRVLPDEDDMQHLKERPPRAYSVGSRMEHNNQKPRVDVVPITDQNNGRVRAFSVGSRSKVPRCDLQRNILMTNANANAANNANMNSSKISVASIEPTSESAVRGRKSCSAPLLIHKSQNSVDRMDDLMEIDFSKNSGSRSNSLSSQSAGSSSYLTNLPKGNHLRGSVLSNLSGLNGSSHNKSHDSVSEPIQVRADSGYLEMRPVMYSHSIGSYDESLEHMSMPNQSSIPDLPEQSRTIAQQPHELTPHNKFKLEDWNKIETPEGYLEMSWNGNKDKDNSYLNELPNTSAKSRSSSSTLTEIKKSRGVTKMPSLINNRTGISKLSVLQEQSQQREQLQNCNSAKTELTQRKRLFDQADTISEEKIPSTEYDTGAPEKIHNQFLELSLRNNDDSSNARVSPNTAYTESSDYVNFSPGIPEQIPSPKKAEPPVVVAKEKPRDKERHAPNLSNQSIETNCTESLDNYCLLNRNTTISTNPGDTNTHPDERSKSARKSNSPKSSNASSLRCHRLNNTNRQPTKPQGSGYELLHICSDSSLQTKKNISRPSSVNSDRIFPLESTQSRPSSVNSDCLQLNSVSSSAATLCFSKNCDNHSQELALRPVPFSSSNNANPEDNNKRTSTDSVSSKDILSAPLTQCPPLQSAALELHYASLDLPISSTKNSNTTIYGSSNNPTRSNATSDDTTASLSPNSNTAQQSTFTYAKIDFNQCESKKYKCATQNNL